MRGGLLPAGQVSGAINDMVDAAEFVPRMVSDAIGTMTKAQRTIACARADDGRAICMIS